MMLIAYVCTYACLGCLTGAGVARWLDGPADPLLLGLIVLIWPAVWFVGALMGALTGLGWLVSAGWRR